jgi:hypothetical protein
VSITQELGNEPAQVMMRQVIALFDEYQSRENAKHVLRAMKENARQGFWKRLAASAWLHDDRSRTTRGPDQEEARPRSGRRRAGPAHLQAVS